MSERVIKQPDGKYSVWNDHISDFVVWDATADDIDTYVVQNAIKKAQLKAMNLIAQAEIADDSLFYEKLALRNRIHTNETLDSENEKEFQEFIEKWSKNEN